MDTQDRKYKIKETFNAAAAGYDKPALRFFKHYLAYINILPETHAFCDVLQ